MRVYVLLMCICVCVCCVCICVCVMCMHMCVCCVCICVLHVCAYIRLCVCFLASTQATPPHTLSLWIHATQRRHTQRTHVTPKASSQTTLSCFIRVTSRGDFARRRRGDASAWSLAPGGLREGKRGCGFACGYICLCVRIFVYRYLYTGVYITKKHTTVHVYTDSHISIHVHNRTYSHMRIHTNLRLCGPCG